MLKLPYAIRDYEALIIENYTYLDRTDRIPVVEDLGKELLFLRPRRFGKSLWLSTLMNYYDINKADAFETLFGHLAVGQNPTPLRNQYLIIWNVTDDPFLIEYKGIKLYADLGAEKPIAAEKAGAKIVLEVKVFSTMLPISELQKAVGQYSIYRLFPERIEANRALFSAIPKTIYQEFFVTPAIQEIVEVHQIALVVFDPEKVEIVQWIK
ncbi:MAG: element excision factor XisH family protein [Chloroflexota bacterium]